MLPLVDEFGELNFTYGAPAPKLAEDGELQKALETEVIYAC